MRLLRYVSSRGEEFQLDGPMAYVGTASALRGRAWAYTLGARGASGIARNAREATVEAVFLDAGEADRLREAAEADLADGSPGALWSGEWSQRAYLPKADVGTVGPGWHSETLTALLLDGAWGRWRSKEFLVPDAPADTGQLDYPHDHPHDLAAAPPGLSVEGARLSKSPVRITVFGPAIDPYVVVGGNRYQFGATIPAGSRLVADGTAWPRTVELVSSAGDRTDAFASAELGGGEGSGVYAFEPLPAGLSAVSWPETFGFTLEWREEAGQLPWLR